MIDPQLPQSDPALRPSTRFIIIAGLIIIVISCIVFIAYNSWAKTQIWFGIGIILLLCAVLLQPDAVQSIFVGRAAKYRFRTLVVGLAFVGILIFANYVSLKSDYEIDLTKTGEFTLSEPTLRFLSNLNEPVQIIGFFKAGDENWKQAEDYLARYSHYTSHLTYTLYDPIQEPAMARSYDLQNYGLVFINGTHHYTAHYVDEQTITTGLMYVTTYDHSDYKKGVSIPPKSGKSRQLVLTPFQAGITFATTVIIIPLIMFVVGVAMWLKQR